MNKRRHICEKTKKKYGNTVALKINNDSIVFISDTLIKKNIVQENPRKFKFKIDYYEKEEKEKSINVVRKLFFKNKLIGTSQKKYKIYV